MFSQSQSQHSDLIVPDSDAPATETDVQSFTAIPGGKKGSIDINISNDSFTNSLNTMCLSLTPLLLGKADADWNETVSN